MRLFRLLLQPSLCSTIISLIIAGLLLGAINWSHFAKSPFFYDYFFGSEGLVLSLEKASGSITGFVSALSAGPFSYNLFVLAISLVIGGLVYFLLKILFRFMSRATSALIDVEEATPGHSKKVVKLELGARVGVRAAAFVVWLIYWFFSVKILLPFCVLTSRVGIDMLPELTGIMYGIGSFLLLALGLQMHVILARLFMLRPRLFGSDDAIAATLRY